MDRINNMPLTGISRHDYFTGQALHAMLSNPSYRQLSDSNSHQLIASEANAIALMVCEESNIFREECLNE